MAKISIITPCYQNEKNISVTFPALLENEKNFPNGTEIEYVFIDDGSQDNTFEELRKIHQSFPHKVKVLRLSRNFGANNASYAGICHSTGDCCVILAADLQDPPELIPELFKHWQNGFKLVLAQKINREDSLLTKFFSSTYHNLIRKIVLRNAPKGGFDLWLFDKSLRDELRKMDEKNFFLPYLFIWMGYRYVSIPYTRRKREIGKSQWTLSKKIKSFIDSFISFSYLPLRMITVLGFLFGLFAILYALSVFYKSLTHNIPIEGWSSLMIVFLLASAFIMVSLGVIGEYMWRTLDATRNRPNYLVDQILHTASPDEGSMETKK